MYSAVCVFYKQNMKKTISPLISVCIPVFDTEPYLAQCLRSVWKQDFADFEIVIVSDASCGRDSEGRPAKKIAKLAQKESDLWRKKNALPAVKIRFIEHHENRGLIEVRRTLCYEARGEYITQCDSDDELEAGALTALYEVAMQHKVDIVHGTSTAGTFGADGSFTPTRENRYGKISYDQFEGHEVFRQWLLNGAFTANTWGKLIRRELWVRAYENIPYTECNMADDLLVFFFLAQYAQSYLGIENKIYRYRVNTGMSSRRKIDTLHKWKMICSTASVFTVISTWISEHSDVLKADEIESIRRRTSKYLDNNILQLREAVIPELQEKAHAMLCDYWGAGFVEKVEKIMDSAEN